MIFIYQQHQVMSQRYKLKLMAINIPCTKTVSLWDINLNRELCGRVDGTKGFTFTLCRGRTYGVYLMQPYGKLRGTLFFSDKRIENCSGKWTATLTPESFAEYRLCVNFIPKHNG
jgi:hypothetical protein